MNEDKNQTNNMNYSFDFANQVTPTNEVNTSADNSVTPEPKLVDVSVPVSDSEAPVVEPSVSTTSVMPESPAVNTVENVAPVNTVSTQPDVSATSVEPVVDESQSAVAPGPQEVQPAVENQPMETVNTEIQGAASADNLVENDNVVTSSESTDFNGTSTLDNNEILEENKVDASLNQNDGNELKASKSTIKFVIIIGVIIVAAIIALPTIFKLIG